MCKNDIFSLIWKFRNILRTETRTRFVSSRPVSHSNTVTSCFFSVQPQLSEWKTVLNVGWPCIRKHPQVKILFTWGQSPVFKMSPQMKITMDYNHKLIMLLIYHHHDPLDLLKKPNPLILLVRVHGLLSGIIWNATVSNDH
jgi:hypothetical protein